MLLILSLLLSLACATPAIDGLWGLTSCAGQGEERRRLPFSIFFFFIFFLFHHTGVPDEMVCTGVPSTFYAKEVSFSNGVRNFRVFLQGTQVAGSVAPSGQATMTIIGPGNNATCTGLVVNNNCNQIQSKCVNYMFGTQYITLASVTCLGGKCCEGK